MPAKITVISLDSTNQWWCYISCWGFVSYLCLWTLTIYPKSYIYIYIYIYNHWRRKRGGQGGHVPPPLFWLGGQWYVCAPPLLTPHLYFPLDLYVYLTLTNNYLAFFIYQLIILWIISINWHRWLLVNNHISKYNSFILVLYRRYINYVSVCPPPPPTHFLVPSYATDNVNRENKCVRINFALFASNLLSWN